MNKILLRSPVIGHNNNGRHLILFISFLGFLTVEKHLYNTFTFTLTDAIRLLQVQFIRTATIETAFLFPAVDLETPSANLGELNIT